MKKINIKELIIAILIPVALGFIFSLFTNSGTVYKEFTKPALSPPGYIFPIVWTILYILMGISSYLVYQKTKDIKSLKIYFIQLAVNLLWTVIFFNLRLYLVAFIWLILLITLVALMIKEFYYIDKKAAYLQIPYLIWIIFASYLNFFIFILN